MKILVVCQYYYPEPFRIHEVCSELVSRGHEVTVLTGLPNYPMGIIPDEYKGREHRDEVIDGVRVIRVSEIPRSEGKVGLAKNYVSFVITGSLKALAMRKDFDVIFVYQLSPVLMAIPAYVAKWFNRRHRLVIYTLDLWPESLMSMGISKTSTFFKFMKFVSKRIYSGANKIGYTSEMFRTYFEDELSVTNDYMYIPQFADELFTDIQQDSLAGDDTINYVFAGNIGAMQAVDTIIRAAAIVTDERIRWHIVGDGSSYNECIELSSKLGLENKVIFHGRKPVDDMPRFYSMARAMIVTLAANETISYTLPGKVQSYMAAGKAILAAANGETKKVIDKSGCGKCAPAQDYKELARLADEMARADVSQYGLRAREYYDNNFSKKSHIDLIEQLLS